MTEPKPEFELSRRDVLDKGLISRRSGDAGRRLAEPGQPRGRCRGSGDQHPDRVVAEVFKRLKQSIKIPMATGERDRTIWGMIPYLQERCIDILQPDCAQTGGISQMHKIATLAEAYTVPLAPHCTCSELGVKTKKAPNRG